MSFTYAQLLEKIQQMTEDQLFSDVTIAVDFEDTTPDKVEYYQAKGLDQTENVDDILDANHPFLYF